MSSSSIEEKQSLWGGFKEFLMRGNVVELAVAVVVGSAFTQIVNAIVESVINPVVGALGPKDLDRYESCLRGPCEWNKAGEAVSGVPIRWGAVLSASLTFLITAAVVYFLMIVPMTKYKERRRANAPAVDTPPAKTEVDLLAEIRDVLIAQRNGTNGAQGVLVAPRTDPDADSSGSGSGSGSGNSAPTSTGIRKTGPAGTGTGKTGPTGTGA